MMVSTKANSINKKLPVIRNFPNVDNATTTTWYGSLRESVIEIRTQWWRKSVRMRSTAMD